MLHPSHGCKCKWRDTQNLFSVAYLWSSSKLRAEGTEGVLSTTHTSRIWLPTEAARETRCLNHTTPSSPEFCAPNLTYTSLHWLLCPLLLDGYSQVGYSDGRPEGSKGRCPQANWQSTQRLLYLILSPSRVARSLGLAAPGKSPLKVPCPSSLEVEMDFSPTILNLESL